MTLYQKQKITKKERIPSIMTKIIILLFLSKKIILYIPLSLKKNTKKRIKYSFKGKKVENMTNSYLNNSSKLFDNKRIKLYDKLDLY